MCMINTLMFFGHFVPHKGHKGSTSAMLCSSINCFAVGHFPHLLSTGSCPVELADLTCFFLSSLSIRDQTTTLFSRCGVLYCLDARADNSDHFEATHVPHLHRIKTLDKSLHIDPCYGCFSFLDMRAHRSLMHARASITPAPMRIFPQRPRRRTKEGAAPENLHFSWESSCWLSLPVASPAHHAVVRCHRRGVLSSQARALGGACGHMKLHALYFLSFIL